MSTKNLKGHVFRMQGVNHTMKGMCKSQVRSGQRWLDLSAMLLAMHAGELLLHVIQAIEPQVLGLMKAAAAGTRTTC